MRSFNVLCIATYLTCIFGLAHSGIESCDLNEIPNEMYCAILDEGSTIPLQAATCDIAGIGRVAIRTNQPDVVMIDSLWYGNYTNQIIELSVKCKESPPTDLCLFFISRSAQVTFTEPATDRYSYIFTLADIRDKVITNPCYFAFSESVRSTMEPPIDIITNTGFYLMNDTRSLIPVNSTNMPMITWASNLIVAAQVETNRSAFCDLLIKGYIATNVPQRMKSDVLYTFWNTDIFLTSNEIFNMYMNTNLDRISKIKLDNAYNTLTGHFITNQFTGIEQ